MREAGRALRRPAIRVPNFGARRPGSEPTSRHAIGSFFLLEVPPPPSEPGISKGTPAGYALPTPTIPHHCDPNRAVPFDVGRGVEYHSW